MTDSKGIKMQFFNTEQTVYYLDYSRLDKGSESYSQLASFDTDKDGNVYISEMVKGLREHVPELAGKDLSDSAMRWAVKKIIANHFANELKWQVETDMTFDFLSMTTVTLVESFVVIGAASMYILPEISLVLKIITPPASIALIAGLEHLQDGFSGNKDDMVAGSARMAVSKFNK